MRNFRNLAVFVSVAWELHCGVVLAIGFLDPSTATLNPSTLLILDSDFRFCYAALTPGQLNLKFVSQDLDVVTRLKKTDMIEVGSYNIEAKSAA
jgi:hypothetical protein